MTTRLRPLPVPLGPDALRVLPELERALAGGPALLPHDPAGPPPIDVDTLPDDAVPDGAALVVGTSGSTGSPKLAVLGAPALHASADATAARLAGPGQWFLTMPARHIAGLQVLVRSLRAGTVPAVMDLADGFTPEAFVRGAALLSDDTPTYVSLVPTQLTRLLADADAARTLATFAAVLVGGAGTAPTLLARAQAAGVRVVTTYGMTETAGGCVYDGLPLEPASVRVVDGRVRLGGATLASGYLGRADLTAAAFVEDGGTRWFVTDDLGEVGADGRLRILGRADDLINTGGLKVAPRLVEEALLAHGPAVSEAVVVGVPDPEWGQVIAAALVLHPDAPPAERRAAADVAAVRERLRPHLAAHALPRRVIVLGALPLRGPGKPARDEVAGLFARD
ncbi:o-succinylbenzoate--CoA ligase [Janibacter sp. G1551]|uniref:o-succinylbenzoate--CoA ligase n=1 Tax=Janibacter sp. G1551 TaxID=3420440 RepID=UPI003CFC9737